MIQIGDFVTARLLGAEDCRQGVVIRINAASGRLHLKGRHGSYPCCLEGAVHVQYWDEETRAFVRSVRSMILAGCYDTWSSGTG